MRRGKDKIYYEYSTSGYCLPGSTNLSLPASTFGSYKFDVKKLRWQVLSIIGEVKPLPWSTYSKRKKSQQQCSFGKMRNDNYIVTSRVYFALRHSRKSNCFPEIFLSKSMGIYNSKKSLHGPFQRRQTNHKL